MAKPIIVMYLVNVREATDKLNKNNPFKDDYHIIVLPSPDGVERIKILNKSKKSLSILKRNLDKLI